MSYPGEGTEWVFRYPELRAIPPSWEDSILLRHKRNELRFFDEEGKARVIREPRALEAILPKQPPWVQELDI